MARIVIGVTGMRCQACVKSVTTVLEAVPGVEQAEVSLDASEASITYDPALASATDFRGAIEDAGFDAN